MFCCFKVISSWIKHQKLGPPRSFFLGRLHQLWQVLCILLRIIDIIITNGSVWILCYHYCWIFGLRFFQFYIENSLLILLLNVLNDIKYLFRTVNDRNNIPLNPSFIILDFIVRHINGQSDKSFIRESFFKFHICHFCLFTVPYHTKFKIIFLLDLNG